MGKKMPSRFPGWRGRGGLFPAWRPQPNCSHQAKCKDRRTQMLPDTEVLKSTSLYLSRRKIQEFMLHPREEISPGRQCRRPLEEDVTSREVKTSQGDGRRGPTGDSKSLEYLLLDVEKQNGPWEGSLNVSGDYPPPEILISESGMGPRNWHF